MTPPAENEIVPVAPVPESRGGAVAWAWLRVALALPVFGLAWALSAAVALALFGARAGWRDMRQFCEGE